MYRDLDFVKNVSYRRRDYRVGSSTLFINNVNNALISFARIFNWKNPDLKHKATCLFVIGNPFESVPENFFREPLIDANKLKNHDNFDGIYLFTSKEALVDSIFLELFDELTPHALKAHIKEIHERCLEGTIYTKKNNRGKIRFHKTILKILSGEDVLIRAREFYFQISIEETSNLPE